MKEVWRVIPSLPEYIASSHGRVMRLPFIGSMPYGGKKHYGGEPTLGVIHPYHDNRPTINFKGKNYRVSRLVCEAFYGHAPFPSAVVMHLDDDQTNNNVDNLRWGTQKENLNTSSFIEYCKSRTGQNSPVIKHKQKKKAS